LKIFESRIHDNLRTIPGTMIVVEKSRLMISCITGAIEVLSLQAEGRKRMPASEFLRGFDPAGWELA